MTDFEPLYAAATDVQKVVDCASGMARCPSADDPAGAVQWRSRMTTIPAAFRVATQVESAALYPATVIGERGAPSTPSQQSWFRGIRTALMPHATIAFAAAAVAPSPELPHPCWQAYSKLGQLTAWTVIAAPVRESWIWLPETTGVAAVD